MAVADGEWQVLVIDISGQANDGFKQSADGTYIAKYLRFDIFNEAMNDATVFDLAYIAMFDSMSNALSFNSDVEQVMLARSKTEYEYVSTEGEISLNLMADATQLFNKGKAAANRFGSVTLSEDGGYVTFAGAKAEATLMIFGNNQTPSGQYVVMKFRIPNNNPDKLGYWNFFCSTVNDGPTGSDAFYGENEQIPADGQWHVIVLDLSARENETFSPAEDGTYIAKYLRFDVFNGAVSDNTSYDVAYVAMSDSLDDILKFNSDMESIILSTDNTEYKLISTATGEEIQP